MDEGKTSDSRLSEIIYRSFLIYIDSIAAFEYPFFNKRFCAVFRNYWKQNVMQAIQEQATPCASREPLIFTLGKREYGINIFQVKNERFSEREISFSVTEAKPGQRRSAALDVSLS